MFWPSQKKFDKVQPERFYYRLQGWMIATYFHQFWPTFIAINNFKFLPHGRYKNVLVLRWIYNRRRLPRRRRQNGGYADVDIYAFDYFGQHGIM